MSDFNRDKFFLEEWPNALRSGKYGQGTGTLLKEDPDGNSFYCCLGVACDLLEKKGLLDHADWINERNLPLKASKILCVNWNGSLSTELQKKTNLSDINDSGECSFHTIADIIVSAYKDDRFYSIQSMSEYS